MDDKRLDALFKSGLKNDTRYNQAESQWAIVADRLQGNKKRRGLWLSLFSGLAVLALAFLTISIPSKPVQISISKDKSQSQEAKHLGEIMTGAHLQESANSVGEQVPSPSVNLKNQKSTINNQESFKPSASVKPKNQVPNNISLPTNIENKKGEKCNCPDDFKENNIPASTLNINTRPNNYVYPKDELQEELEPSTIASSKNGIRLDQLSLLPHTATTNLVYERNIFRTKSSKTLPTKKKKQFRFLLSSGLMKDIYAGNLSDSTAITPYFSLGYKFTHKLSATLTYNQQQVNRSFLQGFDGYKLNTIYLTPEGATIIRGDADYKEQMLDLAIGYELYQTNYFRLTGIGGIQVISKSAGRLSLSVENIYAPEPLDFATPNEAFNLNKSYGGLQVNIPILLGLELELQYKRIFSLSDQLINWGPNNRIALGLTYQLKLQL